MPDYAGLCWDLFMSTGSVSVYMLYKKMLLQ